jgi:hypothetical protein
MSLPNGLSTNYSYPTNPANFGVIGETAKYIGRTTKSLGKGAADLTRQGAKGVKDGVAKAGKYVADKGDNLAANANLAEKPLSLGSSLARGAGETASKAGGFVNKNAKNIVLGTAGVGALGAGSLGGAAALNKRKNNGQFSFVATPSATTANFFLRKAASMVTDAVEGGLVNRAVNQATKKSAAATGAVDDALKTGVKWDALKPLQQQAKDAKQGIEAARGINQRDTAKKLVIGGAAGLGAAGVGGGAMLATRKKDDPGMRAFNRSMLGQAKFGKYN